MKRALCHRIPIVEINCRYYVPYYTVCARKKILLFTFKLFVSFIIDCLGFIITPIDRALIIFSDSMDGKQIIKVVGYSISFVRGKLNT